MSDLVAAGGTGQEIAAAVLRLGYLTGVDVPNISVFDSDVAPLMAGSQAYTRSQVLQDLHDKLLMFGVLGSRRLEVMDPTKVEGAVTPVNTVSDLFSSFGRPEPADKRLLDLILDPDQQRTTIRNGFHGQPAVGSLIFASALQRGGFLDFRTRLDADAQTKEGLRVVFAGSLGGGVGTAIVPVLIQVFSQIKKEHPDRHINILGLFQVPWFQLIQVHGDDLSKKPDVTQAMLDRNSACLIRGYLEQSIKGAMDAAVLVGLPKPVDRVSHGGDRQLETKHYLCLISGILATNLLRENATKKAFGGEINGFYAPTLDIAEGPQDKGDSDQEEPAVHIDDHRRLTIHDLVDLSRSLCAVTESLLFELQVQTPITAQHQQIWKALDTISSPEQRKDFCMTIAGLHGLHVGIREWLKDSLASKVGNNLADTLGAFKRERQDLDRLVSSDTKDVLNLMGASSLLPPLGRRILRSLRPLGAPTESQPGKAAAWSFVCTARDHLIQRRFARVRT